MKKFVAILLTLMLVLGVSAAVAEGTSLPDATFKKVYAQEGGTAPAATFTFTAVPVGSGDGATGNGPALTISNVEATGANTYTAKITPDDEFPTVGKYYYNVSETQGDVAGITYDASALYLMVLVTNGDNGTLVPSYYLYTNNDMLAKQDTFTNTYKAGTLKVSKTVTGNLGDKTKYFEFTVTLTGEADKTYGAAYTVSGGSYANNPQEVTIVAGEKKEYTFMLKDGDTISIANLPYNVGYKVTETAVDGYNTSATGDEGTILAAEQTAAFTNDRGGQIDTGVTTESLPYVVLMGFVVLAGAALLLKRKAHNN